MRDRDLHVAVLVLMILTLVVEIIRLAVGR